MLRRFDRMPACDRQTSCDSIVRTMHSIARLKFMHCMSLETDQASIADETAPILNLHAIHFAVRCGSME